MTRPPSTAAGSARPVTVVPGLASDGRHPAQPAWGRPFARRLAITDALIIGWAAWGEQLRHLADLDAGGVVNASAIAPMAVTVGAAVAWFGALDLTGSRDVRFVGLGGVEYKLVVQATLVLFGGIAICSFAFDLGLRRDVVLVMMPAGLAALLVSRFLWRRWLHRRRRAGDMMTRVLAVGDARTVNALVRDLRHAPMSGYRVIGACVPAGTDPASVQTDVVGTLADVAATVRRINADAVAVAASGAFGADEVRSLGWALDDSPTELMLAPALTNIAGPRVHMQPVAGLPLMHVERPAYAAANRLLKRSFDVVGAGLLLILLSPVLLATAMAVKIDSPGPVLFCQTRAGLAGRTFTIVKFRSMVADAALRLSEFTGRDRDAGNQVLFKLRNDPRVTAVGRVLRRYSIDELPQLLNVITGSMSLVGPRPPLLSEVQLYGTEARRRLLVKPGMTGLWQVSGRSDLTWDDTVRLDMYYVENWSLTVDLAILWKTAKAVVSPAGAY